MLLKKLFFSVITLLSISFAQATPLYWDWQKLQIENIEFPENFLWGTAIAEYQVSGAVHCPDSNWAWWEENTNTPSSGMACNHWNNLDKCVDCAYELGVKALRFSVEWSIIEPIRGQFDYEALKHYQDFCQKLIAAGIQPVVTLHHFTHPQWFEELGAFENKENIEYFVRFSELVFNNLQEYVTIWCTINEPSIYIFQAYLRGVYPPGKTNPVRAARVLKNLLLAHVEVYKKLKELPGGEKSKIGIVHDIIQFEPYNDKPLENMVCKYLNAIINNAVIDFFKTGRFCIKAPLFSTVCVTHKEAPKTLDFIGLNYYSHVLLKQEWGIDFLKEYYRTEDIKTDMPYALYPEGLYRAIQHVAELQVPIYITENGIADADDSRRELFTQRYLYALNRALQDGYDVRGYFYWSLMDNFEWDMGYVMKFGLFEVDFATQERKLRPGANYFIKVVNQKNHKNFLRSRLDRILSAFA